MITTLLCLFELEMSRRGFWVGVVWGGEVWGVRCGGWGVRCWDVGWDMDLDEGLEEGNGDGWMNGWG